MNGKRRIIVNPKFFNESLQNDKKVTPPASPNRRTCLSSSMTCQLNPILSPVEESHGPTAQVSYVCADMYVYVYISNNIFVSHSILICIGSTKLR